jgi:hypothetical protein
VHKSSAASLLHLGEKYLQMSANGRVQQRLLQFTVDRYRKPAEADAVHATSPAPGIRRRHDLEPG